MSDIEIVSQDRWHNDDPDGKVPAGTVWYDSENGELLGEHPGISIEQMLPGAVPAVSWT